MAAKASAPGKAILLGEHAVVYGLPAIAVPVPGVSARVRIDPTEDQYIELEAPAIGVSARLDELEEDDPLGYAVRLAFRELGDGVKSARVRIESDIPLLAGMGSSAAVSVAVLRAVAEFAGEELTPERASNLAFAVERLHHGTPSGIDNSVVAFGRPIYFIRDREPEPLTLGAGLTLLIADTGVPSATAEVVGRVRRAREAEPAAIQALFDEIGGLVDEARIALERGDLDQLGIFMNANQTRLEKLGVSSPKIEALVSAARDAGALGAKLSGAGSGGVVIALAGDRKPTSLAGALSEAGAVRVIESRIES